MGEERTPMQVKRDLRSQMKELKPLLHRGAHQEVAKKLKISDSTVGEVVAGRRWDLNVIEALIEIGKKNLRRALKAESDIKDLVSKKRKATQ